MRQSKIGAHGPPPKPLVLFIFPKNLILADWEFFFYLFISFESAVFKGVLCAMQVMKKLFCVLMVVESGLIKCPRFKINPLKKLPLVVGPHPSRGVETLIRQ